MCSFRAGCRSSIEVYRKKRGHTANTEAQRFEQVSKAVNGIANGKTIIQPK